MNIIESVQKKYLPNFYESRYSSRKKLALSLKTKCHNNPAELTLYELKIVLKVLQQFGLLEKDSALQRMQKELRSQIIQNSVWASMAGMVPWGVRQFYRLGILKRLTIAGVIFCGVDYALMHSDFMKYVQECRKMAQKHINKLTDDSELPL